MSEKTTNIADHSKFQYRKSLRPTIRVFDLGEHEYSGAPGLSWRTNYWVKKSTKENNGNFIVRKRNLYVRENMPGLTNQMNSMSTSMKWDFISKTGNGLIWA